MRMPRAEPLVPRYLRLGVNERLRSDGRVETPLDLGAEPQADHALQARPMAPEELGEPGLVHRGQRGDETFQVGWAIEPCTGCVLDLGTQGPTAVSEQRVQELVTTTEVVADPGVGHPDSGSDGPHGDGGHAAFGQEVRRRVEDFRTGFGRGPSSSRHAPSLP